MDNNYKIFSDKLNTFIKEYYKVKLLNGVVYFIFLLGFIILFFSSIEYFSWSSQLWRLFYLITGLFTLLFFGIIFIIMPLMSLLNIIPRLTFTEAVNIISKYFPENRDTFINVLELSNLRGFNAELLQASLSQKSGVSLKYNFNYAINKKRIFIPIIYVTMVCIIYLIVFYKNPSLVKDSLHRIVHYNQDFIKDYGFSIHIDEQILKVERGENLIIDIYVEGINIPENLFIQYNSNKFLMNKLNSSHYRYILPSVNNEFYFKIVNDYFESKNYNVSIINSPTIVDFSVDIIYPDYINEKNKTESNILNFSVPIGSKLIWNFNTDNVDSIYFLNDSLKLSLNKSGNKYTYTKEIVSDFNYKLIVKNNVLTKELLGLNKISCINDLYPEININYMIDSSNTNIFYFKGSIKDDYGFNQLNFIVENTTFQRVIPIAINKNVNYQEFYYQYDFSIQAMDNLTAYFEIFDNDDLNKFKKVQSERIYYKWLSEEDFLLKQMNLNEKIDSNIREATNKLNDILNNIENLKKKLFSKNLTSFQKDQIFNNLNKKENDLFQILQTIQSQNISKSKLSEEYLKRTKNIFELEQNNKDQLDKLLDEDLQNLLKELAQLKSNFSDKNSQKSVLDLEKQYENYKEMLIRNFELLKKQEVINNFENISINLREIALIQDSVSKIKNKFIIDSLNNFTVQKLDSLSSLLQRNIDKNNQLQKPLNTNDLQNDFNNLNKRIQEENDSIKQNSEKNRDDLNELADKIEDIISNQQKNENTENADKIRQLTENLLQFSFDQEAINKELKQNRYADNSFYKNQLELREKFKLINDSLLTIAKQSAFISSYIFTKSNHIEFKLIEIERLFNEKNITPLEIEQRLIIENSNDLILLLSESLKNMDSFGNGGSSSSKSKKKKQKPSMGDLRSNSESLKEQLKQMISKMKQEGGSSGNGNTNAIGKYLSEQEKFQQMLNNLMNAQNIGNDQIKQLNEINKLLNENKSDLLNKKITSNLIERQNKITTRLLEAEQAKEEREYDEQRKSNESINFKNELLKVKFQNENQLKNFDEILSKSTIYLNYFYKEKFQDFINKVNMQPNEKGTNNPFNN